MPTARRSTPRRAPSPRRPAIVRRLNFNNVQLSPNRSERGMLLSTLYEEALRLSNLNLNRHSRNNRAIARGFITNVINANQGNQAAVYRAIGNLPRVRRIGGGNITPERLPEAHRAATIIQARARGMAGRRRANYRRAVGVIGPNGTPAVAIPARRVRSGIVVIGPNGSLMLATPTRRR